MPDEERIRRRAHELWEKEGRPEGRHEQHWDQARREIEQEESDAPQPSSSHESDAETGGIKPAHRTGR
jgi:hypothetical protein